MFSLSSRSLLVLALIGLAYSPASSSAAYIYNFERVSNNSSSNVADQLSVELKDASGGVSFTFKNTGSTASIITQIYFDWTTALVGPVSLNSTTGVSFESPATPGDLPSKPSGFTADYSLGRTNQGGSSNGINNYDSSVIGPTEESLTVTFAGTSLASAVAAMNDGKLRIGLHVQAIAPDGKSDSFVNDDGRNNPNNIVPVPSAVLLLLTACPALGWYYRRSRRSVTR